MDWIGGKIVTIVSFIGAMILLLFLLAYLLFNGIFALMEKEE